MKLNWKHIPANGQLKESYSGNFNAEKSEFMHQDAFLVKYDSGWTVIEPKEMRGQSDDYLDVLKTRVEKFLNQKDSE